jgi:gluconate 2-dehydrogenase gamma chain
MHRPTRRQFCEHALFGLGAVSLSALAPLACRTRSSAPTPATSDAGGSGATSTYVPRTFTAATFAILSAVCERLLPRDQDPGAIDLGVPGYIDAMAATPELASVRELLVRVLPALDKDSKKRFGGKAFAEVDSAEQDTILDSWRHGKDGSQHFFDVILSLTMEGAFGDPKYGGNTGGRGFDMIGFRPDPPLKKMTPMAPMPGMQHGNPP